MPMDEVVETKLAGNAKLSALVKDAEGNLLGFVVDNPLGPDLNVDLHLLTIKNATAAQNNQLRKVVYDTYALGVKAVPAFTPLLECVAESATVVVHSDADWEGMRFVFVPVLQPNKPVTNFYANIQGNPLLPDSLHAFSFGGITHDVILEQQNKYYLGKDGRWYTTNPLELVSHELAHGCGKLQGWTQAAEGAYVRDLQSGKVPEYEIKAISFVNTTLLEPRGLPGRVPESYYQAKPESAAQGATAPLDADDIEKLRHGTIPAALKAYSQPVLNAVDIDEPQSRLSQALELAGVCEAPQSALIAERILENAATSSWATKAITLTELQR